MKYNLQFIKISPEHQFAGVGFAGNIFITLNALGLIETNDRLYVDMETNECACTEKNETILGTNNCWEYYFDQIKIGENESFVGLDSLISAKISYENRELFMNPENFIDLKNKFYDNFQLKPYLKEMLDNYYDNNIKGKTTLGVQVRLTDMKHYHNVSPIESYITKINDILSQRPEIDQIFLSTDDGSIIENIKTSVNVPVIYYENMFRANNDNKHLHPYDRFVGNREQHRYILGIECIQEIFTLSKCDYMLKADLSSISIIASILSENIKQIYKL
jgi:hypothetical protein